MSGSDAAPLPRLGEVFFDVRGSTRSMRLSWYSDTGVAVFSIWQGGTCTGTFRLPAGDLARLTESLQRGGPADELSAARNLAQANGVPVRPELSAGPGASGPEPYTGMMTSLPDPQISTGAYSRPPGTAVAALPPALPAAPAAEEPPAPEPVPPTPIYPDPYGGEGGMQPFPDARPYTASVVADYDGGSAYNGFSSFNGTNSHDGASAVDYAAYPGASYGAAPDYAAGYPGYSEQQQQPAPAAAPVGESTQLLGPDQLAHLMQGAAEGGDPGFFSRPETVYSQPWSPGQPSPYGEPDPYAVPQPVVEQPPNYEAYPAPTPEMNPYSAYGTVSDPPPAANGFGAPPPAVNGFGAPSPGFGQEPRTSIYPGAAPDGLAYPGSGFPGSSLQNGSLQNGAGYPNGNVQPGDPGFPPADSYPGFGDQQPPAAPGYPGGGTFPGGGYPNGNYPGAGGYPQAGGYPAGGNFQGNDGYADPAGYPGGAGGPGPDQSVPDDARNPGRPAGFPGTDVYPSGNYPVPAANGQAPANGWGGQSQPGFTPSFSPNGGAPAGGAPNGGGRHSRPMRGGQPAQRPAGRPGGTGGYPDARNGGYPGGGRGGAPNGGRGGQGYSGRPGYGDATGPRAPRPGTGGQGQGQGRPSFVPNGQGPARPENRGDPREQRYGRGR